MRSFSVVLAWFFACLVVFTGEVQEVEFSSNQLGVSTMCRYRKFHKDLRKVSNMTDKPTISDFDETNGKRVPKSDSKGKRGNFKGKFGQNRKATDDSPISKMSSKLRTEVLNAFFPPLGVKVPEAKYKYPTSHYEIDFTSIKISGFANILDAVYSAETDPSQLDASVRLGGPKFHEQVLAAAFKANKEFLNTSTAIPINELVGAFYTILRNSRFIYAHLCVALRSQNMVNAVDQDGVYLNPIFSDHEFTTMPVDAVSTTYDDYWQKFQGLNVMSSLASRHSSAYVSYSDAVSNAWWLQLWSNAMNYIRLPKRWMDWIENLFIPVHAVLPAQGSAIPRYVVFWPSGNYFLESTTTPGTIAYARYQAWLPLQYGIPTGNASLVTDLEPVIDSCAEVFNVIMQKYPQLQIMFDEMNCHNTLELDITRDMAGRKIIINEAPSVEKLIEDAAVPLYQWMNTPHSAIEYYFMYRYNNLVTKPPVFWTSLNPKINYDTAGTRLHTRDFSAKTLVYSVRQEFTDMDALILNYHIAPIQFTSFVDYIDRNAGSNPRYQRYVKAPLFHLSDATEFADDLVNSSWLTTALAVRGFVGSIEDAQIVKARLRVLPRRIWECDDLTSSLTSTEKTLLGYGVYPLWKPTGNEYFQEDLSLSLENYIVPELTQTQVMDEYFDYLSTLS